MAKKASKKLPVKDAEGPAAFPPEEAVKQAPKVPKAPERPPGPTPEEVGKAGARVELCLEKAQLAVAEALERVKDNYRHTLASEGQVRNILRLDQDHLAHETVRMVIAELTRVRPEDL